MTSRWRSLATTIVFCCLALSAFAAPVPFHQVVELAAQHSAAVASAQADEARARAAYLEVRDAYLPQVTVGSGLGYSLGFPLSMEGAAPSIFNVTSQQAVYNPAQRQFMNAAKAELAGSSINVEDKRKQAMLDAAVAYMQLDAITGQLQLLTQQQQDTQRLQSIVLQRVNAGVESPVAEQRARLESARVRLRSAQLKGAADQLRAQLALLTGLNAQEIDTD